MHIVVFDCEMTSLNDGQICQICYLTAKDGQLSGKNFFFAVDWMDESAQAVHNLSVERLEELSGGEVFADRAREIADDFAAADVAVGHNLEADIQYLSMELARLKMKITLKNRLCTQSAFTPLMMMKRKVATGRPKPPKLSELTAFFGISEEQVAAACAEVFAGGDAAHDARYDVMATYLCLMAGVAGGHIRLV